MNNEKNVPECIGFIMDGNRRWAKEKGLPTFEGHRRGLDTFKESAQWAKEAGVKNFIYYALSTENWNRPKEEVSYLLGLFKMMIEKELDTLKKENTRIIFAGDLTRFPDDLMQMMEDTMKETQENTNYTLVVAVSYGGRSEIVHAVNSLLKEGKESVNEEEFSQSLWTKDIPDPDIIIRTGGEKRLSNFLPWQSVYSELFFSKTYWPDFSKEEFLGILDEFSSRERRIGK